MLSVPAAPQPLVWLEDLYALWQDHPQWVTLDFVKNPNEVKQRFDEAWVWAKSAKIGWSSVDSTVPPEEARMVKNLVEKTLVERGIIRRSLLGQWLWVGPPVPEESESLEQRQDRLVPYAQSWVLLDRLMGQGALCQGDMPWRIASLHEELSAITRQNLPSELVKWASLGMPGEADEAEDQARHQAQVWWAARQTASTSRHLSIDHALGMPSPFEGLLKGLIKGKKALVDKDLPEILRNLAASNHPEQVWAMTMRAMIQSDLFERTWWDALLQAYPAMLHHRDEQGRTWLHQTIHMNHQTGRALAWWVKHGLDVNDVDDRGRTALFEACSKLKGGEMPVLALIKLGADPDRADREGRVPMHEACRFAGTKDLGVKAWEALAAKTTAWAAYDAYAKEPLFSRVVNQMFKRGDVRERVLAVMLDRGAWAAADLPDLKPGGSTARERLIKEWRAKAPDWEEKVQRLDRQVLERHAQEVLRVKPSENDASPRLRL